MQETRLTRCDDALTIRPVPALLSLLLALLAPASQPSPDHSLAAYVITLGPGDEPWEKFGHNMIYFRDETADIDVAFNWGMFDFDQPNFIWHFVQGKLWYWMEGFPSGIIELYVDQDRLVQAQRLNLSPQQTRKLYDLCVTNAQPENKFYLYDYFKNNCSTKVRDAIDAAVDGQLQSQATRIPSAVTFRSESLRLTCETPWLYTGLDFILGHPTDAPLNAWDEMFIPARLHDRIAQMSITDHGMTRPLVAEERLLHASGRTPLPERPPRWLGYFVLAGVLVAAGCLLPGAFTNRWLRRAALTPTIFWLLLSALAGCLCLFTWFGTDHVAAGHNENVLQLSPLALPLLIAWPLALRRRARWAKIAIGLALACAVSSLLGLLLKVLPAMNQVNANLIGLAVPANAGMAFGIWRQLRCEQKPLPPPSRG